MKEQLLLKKKKKIQAWAWSRRYLSISISENNDTGAAALALWFAQTRFEWAVHPCRGLMPNPTCMAPAVCSQLKFTVLKTLCFGQ